MNEQRVQMRCETECIRSLLFIFGLIYECNGIVGPKKLYSVDLPTTPVSVKVCATYFAVAATAIRSRGVCALSLWYSYLV